MLNTIWPIFIIISFIFAIVSGNIESLNSGIFDSVKDAVQLTISFLGTMCLWSGIMKIVQETTMINKLSKMFMPLMKWLFPELNEKSSAYKAISMNIIANLLGLGNAATPLGINAMRELQRENIKKEELSNSMAMFIVINTASLQIIPTTVIAIRTSLGSENACVVIFPIWVATIMADFIGIMVSKMLAKKF